MEGDATQFPRPRRYLHFNPHPPNGGRRFPRRSAPTGYRNFNPRPSCGGRQGQKAPLSFNVSAKHFREPLKCRFTLRKQSALERMFASALRNRSSILLYKRPLVHIVNLTKPICPRDNAQFSSHRCFSVRCRRTHSPSIPAHEIPLLSSGP